MDRQILKKLQETEIEILCKIHDYCLKNNILYSLYVGSALGAVRHQGFIPWDDDMDIVMTRDNYERFCALWEKNPIEGFFLQNTDTDFFCGISHAKIRKDNTILLSEGEDINKGHHGIWIDIFILDKVRDNNFSRIYIYWNALKRFMFGRGFSINTTEKKSKQILKSMLRKIPLSLAKKIVLKANENIQCYKNLNTMFVWKSLSCVSALKIEYPEDMTNKYEKIKFGEHEFMIFEEHDIMLKELYGDYMQLPPKEEQVCKHKPVKIEF